MPSSALKNDGNQFRTGQYAAPLSAFMNSNSTNPRDESSARKGFDAGACIGAGGGSACQSAAGSSLVSAAAAEGFVVETSPIRSTTMRNSAYPTPIEPNSTNPNRHPCDSASHPPSPPSTEPTYTPLRCSPVARERVVVW